ncbi:hypothetical protein MKQ70_18160 [Chitinophaga sedimenti]|uniref:hypothetical protein n=1 Tax=Chitinophaga sedimenti TaxID=2033606 RepID=UPI002004AF5D|nr:hypothetical protein [Chitinophaga sedimenti]MCK7556837.1 hypothetical protein [Chitinophaga sedimenti]
MAVPGIILVGYLYGVVGALMLILMILFASVFTIFMINALYLIALRITTPERFKEIINYLQIAFSVMVFAMYYLVPKLVNMATLKDIHLLDYTYLYILPPFWFAGGWVSVVLGRWDMVYIAMLACALVLPMLCLWLVVTRLAPSFNRRLALVSGSGGDTPAVVAQRSQRKFYRNIGKWLSRGRLEQTAFEAVWLMTGRSREFKLKVYPSLAYVFIWFAYMLFSGSRGTPEQAWRNLPDSQLHIILLYISCFAFITAIAQLGYSSKFKAGWVYYAAPLQSPGQILAGALKALMVKFFLPYYLLITAFVLWIWGIKAVPDLLLGLLNIIVLCVVFAFIFLRKLPFSMEQNVQQSGGRILLSIVGILVSMAFGAAHFLVRNSLPLKGIFVVLSAALLWLIFTRYREVSWEELKKA